MHKDIEEILLTSEQINHICKVLGKQITNDYQNKDLVLVGLLNGCVPFISDLAKYIDLKLIISFMSVSSYSGGTTSLGDVKIKYDLQQSIENKDILIVEDIVDTGNTLSHIVSLLKLRGAKSVKVVTLLDKPEGRIVSFVPDYIGKSIKKAFVVGYGLDYQEYYRNLPYVGILKPALYLNK